MNPLSNLNKVSYFTYDQCGVFQFDSPLFKTFIEQFPFSKVIQLVLEIRERIKSHHGNHGFFPFLDGTVFSNFKVNDLNHLTSDNFLSAVNNFPCSVKLTGLQLISPEIRSLTQKIFEDYGFPMTCNLYITPAGDRNCFTYHIDPHKVFIIQLWGQKTWHFPFQAGSGDYIFSPEIISTEEHQSHTSISEVLIQAGESMAISKGILHKAVQSGNSPSLHLSFACLQPDLYDFYQFQNPESQNLGHEIKKNLRYKTDLTPERVIEVFQNLKIPYFEEHLLKELSRFKEFKTEEALFITKFGRNYKMK